jgi:hypothetical protein
MSFSTPPRAKFATKRQDAESTDEAKQRYTDQWESGEMTLSFGTTTRYDVVADVLTIPRGTLLFRGRPDVVTTSLHDGPLWFSSDTDTAAIYGYTDIYQAQKQIVVLNLQEPKSHLLARTLYVEWAKRHRRVRGAFDDAYPVIDGLITRDSTFDTDAMIVEWFVDEVEDRHGPLFGFAGFGSLDTPVSANSTQTHHAEVLLVRPALWLDFVETMQRHVATPKRTEYAYKQVSREEARRRAAVVRQRSNFQAHSSLPAARALMFDPADSDP